MTSEEITPNRIEGEAALLRCLTTGLSVPESVAAAKRMLEKAVEVQRPLTKSELDECVRKGVEAAAEENRVELDPDRIVDYDETFTQ